MEDLQTIALSALTHEAASNIRYENVKPKQIQAVLEFYKGKDVFDSHSTGYGKTLIFAVLPSLFYPASAFCISSKREGAPSSSEARDASASVSHLAISLLRSVFIACLW